MEINIRDLGARTTDILQTEIIQKAIDDCFLAGGGTVIIPKGIYRSGGLRLRSNVTLYLESGAILEGSSDYRDYFSFLEDKIEPISKEELEYMEEHSASRSANPYSQWSNALIRGIFAKNCAVIGEEFSYIDGMACYDPNGEEKYRGPHPFTFYRCENVTMKGYTIRRSANWGHNFVESKNLVFENITLFGGHDGLDIRSCDNVLINNCFIDSGDDSIAGFNNNDVIVKDCTLGSSCSVFRFGGNNVVFDNCKSLPGGSFGFRGHLSDEDKIGSRMTNEKCKHSTSCIFLYYCDFRAEINRTPGNITIKNCEFEDCMRIFRLNWNENYVWCCNRVLEQLKFENCTFNNVSDSIYVHGDPEHPMNLEFENCVITVKPGFEDKKIAVGIDFGTMTFKNVTLNGYKNPRIIKKTEGKVIIENSTEMEIVEEYIENTSFNSLTV